MGGSSFTLEELANHVDARVEGDGKLVITGLGSLETAQSGQLSHLSSSAYRHYLADSEASAVILAKEDLENWRGSAIVTSNPYLAFARISQLFVQLPEIAEGVDASARVDPSVIVAPSAAVGPGVVIGPDCEIGPDARIYAHVTVGERCRIGKGVVLMSGAILASDVRLGARSIIHSGAVIGSDGFGFTPDEKGHLQAIAQLGGVNIGEHVSIGACTSIDRGAIDDTVIEDGVKIDNQVQIGHNCRIGAHTIICGCVGIVGSTTIGRHCMLAGGVGVGGDGPITICDQVVLTGTTYVASSISEPGVYSGGVLHAASRQWKRNVLRFRKLDDLYRRVVKVEKVLAGKEDPLSEG